VALDHLKIKSRSKLLLLAGVGLLLMNVRDFVPLSRSQTLASHIIGCLLFFIILWNLVQTYDQPFTEPEDTTSDSWKTATLAITGTALLLASRFAHLRPSLHGLSSIAGWLLVLACWSFPKSRWQAFALSGVYLIALSDIGWKGFAAFRGVPIYITITLGALWLTVSALTYLYLFLSRPKPATSPLD
jgi:hypothetical protein